MDKKKLDRTFLKVKEKANMDYAITNTDKFGDCNTCVNDSLIDAFGRYSTGIYAKHWRYGMNQGKPWTDVKELYIAHDITPKQAEILIDVFTQNGYDIEPKEYDESKAFVIREV